eukprot:gene20371-7382_t
MVRSRGWKIVREMVRDGRWHSEHVEAEMKQKEKAVREKKKQEKAEKERAASEASSSSNDEPERQDHEMDKPPINPEFPYITDIDADITPSFWED